MTEKKVLKFENFLNDVLKEDLKFVLKQREDLTEQIVEYEQLKSVIEQLQEQELDKNKFKTKVDLGCNFYVQANIPDTKYIFVKVGLGLFVQFTLEEAVKFIDTKIDFVRKLVDKSTKKSAEINAHIQVVLQGLRELQNIQYLEPESPKRELW